MHTNIQSDLSCILAQAYSKHFTVILLIFVHVDLGDSSANSSVLLYSLMFFTVMAVWQGVLGAVLVASLGSRGGRALYGAGFKTVTEEGNWSFSMALTELSSGLMSSMSLQGAVRDSAFLFFLTYLQFVSDFQIPWPSLVFLSNLETLKKKNKVFGEQ